ncbi:MAG: T9SS type A sorting domain-containing protein [bacterium]|nr:T9SS type A sorting domain-containing protein [bacterium]
MWFILLIVLWISSAWAQAPGVDWSRLDVLGSDLEGQALVEAPDGGIVVAGYTNVSLDYDVYLLKTFFDGTTDWTVALPDANDEQATGVTNRTGGGYAVSAMLSAFGGPADFRLYFISATGALESGFITGDGDDEVPFDILRTSDDGFLLVGYKERATSGRDVHLVKFSAAGAVLWSKTYGGAASDVAYAAVETPDLGFAIVAVTESFGFGGRDAWLLRTDANGDSLWSAFFLSADDEVTTGIDITSDGGFVLGGFQQTTVPVDQNILLIRTNSAGGLVWQTLYDNGGFDVATDVLASADGGIVLCGRSDGDAASEEAYIMKVDEIGQFYWEMNLGTTSNDAALAMIQTATSAYALTGYSPAPDAEVTRMFTAKLLPDVGLDGPLPVELLSFGATSRANGIALSWATASETAVERFELWRGQDNTFERIHTVGARGNSAGGGEYAFVDEQVTAQIEYSYFLTLVHVNGQREELRERLVTATWSGAELLPQDFAVRAYPNPFNPATTIEFTLPEAGAVELSIWDNNGRLLETLTRTAAAGVVRFDWDAAGFATGSYFARVRAAGLNRVVPLVLVR